MRPFLSTALAATLLFGLLQAPTAVAETDPPPSEPTSSQVWPVDPDPPDLTSSEAPSPQPFDRSDLTASDQSDLTSSAVWPLHPEPSVVNGFDLPGARWEAGHRGVDLLGRPAQRVVAPLAGVITHVGKIAGRGVVTLSHGETRTTYEPVMSDLGVGAEVAAGELLGWLHPTGSHCAPDTCLHWGWKRDAEYLDPMRLVGRTRIRLLPLWSARQDDW